MKMKLNNAVRDRFTGKGHNGNPQDDGTVPWSKAPETYPIEKVQEYREQLLDEDEEVMTEEEAEAKAVKLMQTKALLL